MIFDKNLFDPNVFQTDETSSGTESSVVEKKRGRSRSGRSRGFLWRPVKKDRKVFIGFESYGHKDIRAFKPTPVTESLAVESINLDDVDPELFMNEAKEQVISAASKATDIKTVKKTIEVVSMRPKRVPVLTDSHSLITMARELIESAKDLIEKPSLPQVEPSLYGDLPMYEYGEVEFKLDRKIHKEPDECDDYNGEVFSYGPDGLEDGAPVPPLHPSCRCKLIDTKTRQPMHFPGSEFDTIG